MTDPHSPAKAAMLHLINEYGTPKTMKTSADGIAAHFGNYGMFIPGLHPGKLEELIQKRTEELACAYIAYQAAIRFAEADQEGEEMS